MSSEDTLKSLAEAIALLGDKNLLVRENSNKKLISQIIPQVIESQNQDIIY